jgi:DNA-binding LacI/PurR family transcriptional regulator
MTKTRTIGIFSRIFEGNLSGGILRRIHKIARQHNIKLIAVRTMSENLYTYPLALDLVDGWLIINDPISDQLLLEIHQRGQPIVGINRAITCIPCPTVLPNNNEGMYIAVKHLIVNGHRTLAFIGQLTSLAIKERLLGYKRALDEYGIHYNPDLIYDTNNMYYKGGHDVAIQLIDQGMPCTAIVTGTDLNAMGLIEKLRESGYRTPEDIAIVSFDNLSYANSYDPPLSTVNLPVGEMAEIGSSYDAYRGMRVHSPAKLWHYCGDT